MASYKSHMAFGIFTAIGWSALLFSFSFISIWLVPLIILLTVIGSFLPDLDSDTGLPLKILLTITSMIGSLVAGFYVFSIEKISLILSLFYIFLSYIFIYFGIGGIVKKITRHRGIFHSIPSVFLSILLTLTFLKGFSIDLNIKMILSMSVGVGYLCHLILDEMNSVVNLEGIPFIPKKSLGTALKLYSSHWKITLLVYLAIAVLLLNNWEIINTFYLNTLFK